MRKLLCAVAAIIALFSFTLPAAAQQGTDKTSWIKTQQDHFTINADGSVRIVTQRQNHYVGSYHRYSESHSRAEAGSVTDVQVTDNTGNRALKFSPRKLNALEPVNWGKFTQFDEGGSQAIEWYKEVSDADQEWELAYTVHPQWKLQNGQAVFDWTVTDATPMPIYSHELLVTFPAALPFSDAAAAFRASRSSGGQIQAFADEKGSYVHAITDHIQPNETYRIEIALPSSSLQPTAWQTRDTVSAPADQPQRYYHYRSINADLRVNSDATYDVQERQTFAFTGTYHQAVRSIPLSGLYDISDISVSEGNGGRPLTYSEDRLDKTLPGSWGKYTTYRSEGIQYIEWYYNQADAEHTWTVSYRVSGNMRPGKPYDRIYWNIFSGYDVSVDRSEVTVRLPKPARDLQLKAYRTSGSAVDLNKLPDGTIATISAQNFYAGEAFTIDLGVPHGVVSPLWFVVQYLKAYGGYAAAILMALLSLLFAFGFWWKAEKQPEHGMVIVPEYAPPQHLPPAMAEIITKEQLSFRGLSATVVDLAIRGYLRIESDRSVILWNTVAAKILLLIVLGGIMLLVYNIYAEVTSSGDRMPYFIVAAIVLLAFLGAVWSFAKSFRTSEFKVIKAKEFEDDSQLQRHEKRLLKELFSAKEYFSTGELKKSSPHDKQRFHQAIEGVREMAYEDANVKVKAFTVGVENQKKRTAIWSGIAVAVYVLIDTGLAIFVFEYQWVLFAAVAVLCTVGLWGFIRYEARLSDEGRRLKREWLGFKLYLQTAERDRLRNLQPNEFSKYLPYAIVFGVERNWARAFDSLALPQQEWYSPAMGSSAYVAFSPFVFRTSFSSSLSSAYAASGGRGGGFGGGFGGGGGAGGGGGGGGGGAS